MTKPDDMPQDIWDAADAEVERMPERSPFKSDVRLAIARAILAERERGVTEHMARLHKEDVAAMEEFDRKVRNMAPASDGWGTRILFGEPIKVVID